MAVKKGQRLRKGYEPMTEQEIKSLPLHIYPRDVARILNCNLRFVQDNAEKFGGVKLGGRWTFFKPVVLSKLGLQSLES